MEDLLDLSPEELKQLEDLVSSMLSREREKRTVYKKTIQSVIIRTTCQLCGSVSDSVQDDVVFVSKSTDSDEPIIVRDTTNSCPNCKHKLFSQLKGSIIDALINSVNGRYVYLPKI